MISKSKSDLMGKGLPPISSTDQESAFRIKRGGARKGPEVITVNREVLNQNINVQLYEVLKESGIDYNTIKLMVKHKTRISQAFKQSKKTINAENIKNWRTKRKLMVHRDIGNEYRDKLRGFYDNIAGDKKAEGIGADELEDPLITLGISKNKSEIEKILHSFKTHIPGKLSFEEFLSILNGNKIQKRNTASSTAILEFFRSRLA